MKNKTKIYVWPDGFWEYAENIDDMDLYLSTLGRSDDYFIIEVNSEADYDEIEDLVNSAWF